MINSGHIPHPGIGPSREDEEIIRHAYYQWVPFVLFLQALMFYLPHYVWKQAEGNINFTNSNLEEKEKAYILMVITGLLV